jgi:hypothetical protein
MRCFLLAATLAVGLSGVSPGSAKADKTWNSDPATGYSTREVDESGAVYCNAAGTRCWRTE